MSHSETCTTSNGYTCGSSQNPSSKLNKFLFRKTFIIVLIVLAKEWQQALPQDHRSCLVKKIVSYILNTIQQDSHSLSPERLAAITNYAQKTEADMYNTATSHEDYFQRLAERIYRIRKDYDEKQMLKKQQILTTTLSNHADKDCIARDDNHDVNRLTICSNNSNTHTEINVTHVDTTLIKTEEISSSHDTNIQVRI